MVGEPCVSYGGGQKGSLARLKQHAVEKPSASGSGRGGQAKAGLTVCCEQHYREQASEAAAWWGSGQHNQYGGK